MAKKGYPKLGPAPKYRKFDGGTLCGDCGTPRDSGGTANLPDDDYYRLTALEDEICDRDGEYRIFDGFECWKLGPNSGQPAKTRASHLIGAPDTFFEHLESFSYFFHPKTAFLGSKTRAELGPAAQNSGQTSHWCPRYIL